MGLSTGWKRYLLTLALSLAVAASIWYITATAATAGPSAADQTCLVCHGNSSFAVERGGQQVSLYVEASELAASSHAVNSCINCHAQQAEFPHSSEEAVDLAQQVADNCQTCHAGVPGDLKTSIHTAAGITCTSCHDGGHSIGVQQPQARQTDAQCQTCHQEASEAFAESSHSETGEATCISCHGEGHTILASSSPSSPVARANVVDTCNQCHDVSGVAVSYAESFHGKAVKLGSSQAPTCVSCHGSHSILSPENPNSSVAKANIPQTCAQCHNSAQANFAAGKEHFELKPEGEGKAMFYTLQFFTWLTIMAVTLLIIHIELELWRRFRDLKPGDKGK